MNKGSGESEWALSTSEWKIITDKAIKGKNIQAYM